MSAITLQTDIAHKHFSHFRPGIAELIFQLGKVRVNKNKQKNKSSSKSLSRRDLFERISFEHFYKQSMTRGNI